MNIILQSWEGMVNKIRPQSKQQIIITSAILLGVVLVVLLLVLLPGNRTKKTNFALYTSNQGAFSVEAPDGMMEFSSAPSTFLDLKITRFSHVASLPGGICSVVHFDMPPGVISPSDHSSVFNTLITGFFEEFNGVMEQSDPVMIDGNPGMSALATGTFQEKPMEGEVMVVMAANRIFIIGVYGEEKEIRRKDVNHFITSFTFNF